MRGKIIVIEGTDCSGKETQTRNLLKKLNDNNILTSYFSYPNYDSPTGKIVGGPYLGKAEICKGWFLEKAVNVDPYVSSLFFAADRRYNYKEILKFIDDGVNVIIDRYVYSNMAHQAGKFELVDERIKLYDFLDKLEFDLLELPKPDLLIFLHMPTEYATILKKNRLFLDEHEEDENYLKKAEMVYKEIAGRYNFKTIECVRNKEIRSIESINAELLEYVLLEVACDGTNCTSG
ncbi:MAG: thymidylate kinase [Bacilli bacterium]